MVIKSSSCGEAICVVTALKRERKYVTKMCVRSVWTHNANSPCYCLCFEGEWETNAGDGGHCVVDCLFACNNKKNWGRNEMNKSEVIWSAASVCTVCMWVDNVMPKQSIKEIKHFSILFFSSVECMMNRMLKKKDQWEWERIERWLVCKREKGLDKKRCGKNPSDQHHLICFRFISFLSLLINSFFRSFSLSLLVLLLISARLLSVQWQWWWWWWRCRRWWDGDEDYSVLWHCTVVASYNDSTCRPFVAAWCFISSCFLLLFHFALFPPSCCDDA